MRVIRPRALSATARRRPVLLAASLLAAGVLLLELTLLESTSTTSAAVGAATSAVALGIGLASLLRVIRPTRSQRMTDALAALLGTTLGDDYALVLAPRLPVRDGSRLDGVLIGPAGVRVLTVRDWVGRYRVRGRVWEFDARGRRGWIRCRTNPSYEAGALADGVVRWARETGLPDLPLKPAVVFPKKHSDVVLEEPEDEVITADNAPWWAHSIGRIRRLDPAVGARLVEALLDAAEPAALPGRPRLAERP